MRPAIFVARAIRCPARAARRALFLLALITACNGDSTAPLASTPPAGLQRIVDSIARAERIPGVIVRVRNADGTSYALTSGVSSLGTRRAVQADDRFRAASITKAMVATVILQLADEGKLSLDASVATYLPTVVPNANGITVRQLLNHTAGLPDFTNDPQLIESLLANPGRVWTPLELIALANGMPPLFEPGSPGGFAYSNTDYIVLGLVAERVSGRALGAELQTRLFDKLGMSSTLYSSTTSLPAPFAEGYLDLDEANRDVAVGTVVSPTWAGAAGAVVSTADDLTRFVTALADGTLHGAATQSARLAPVPASLFRISGDRFDTGYGLGVIVSNGWVGHNGAIPGYESEAFAKRGVGSIVVLINRTTDSGASQAILAAVRDAQFGMQ